MMLFGKLPVLFIATVLPSLVSAVPFLEGRTGGICNSGIYGSLVPLLTGYSPAQAYCTQHYPVKCTIAQAKVKRTTATTTSKTTTTTTSKTTSVDSQSSACSKLQQQVSSIASTLCSCIESPTVSEEVLQSRSWC